MKYFTYSTFSFNKSHNIIINYSNSNIISHKRTLTEI